MKRRDKIQLQQLETLDAEFRELLIPCLVQCSRGRWGLFGSYDRLVEEGWSLAWPEAIRLHELAVLIEKILDQSGEQNVLCSDFLKLRNRHGQNDPGEPKLARAFLDQIERDSDEHSSGGAFG
jgi:hypothetical protein